MNFKHDKNCLSQPLKDVLIVPNSKPPEPKEPVMREFWIVETTNGSLIPGREIYSVEPKWALLPNEKTIHVREVEQPKEEPVDNSKSNYKRVQAMKGESMEPQESPKLEQEERIRICSNCGKDAGEEWCLSCLRQYGGKFKTVKYIPESHYLALSDRLKVAQEAIWHLTDSYNPDPEIRKYCELVLNKIRVMNKKTGMMR